MLVLVIVLLTAMGVYIQPDSTKDLRKEIGNPVSVNQMATVDFSMHQNTDPFNRTQEILEFKGKFYSDLETTAAIHYAILPVISQPMSNENRNQFGSGNLEYRGYLTSKQQSNWVFALGPDIRFPTATSEINRDPEWSGGVAVIVLYQPSIFTVGGELVQVWGENISQTEVQPIVNLRIGKKTSINMLDKITVNWKAEKENRWTIPMGVEVGQLFRAQEAQPVNFSFGVFGNVVRPDKSSDWYWRLKLDLPM